MKRIQEIIKLLSAYFVRLNFNINSNEFSKIYKNGLVYFFNDTLSNEISIFGIFEKEQLNKVIKIFVNKKKNLFIDIGANIGNHSIFLSKFFKNVLAFEAHPKIFEILNLNTKKIKNIKSFNIALSDKKKFLYFKDIQTQNMAGHSLRPKGEIKVKTTKLDDIVKLKNKIDFIKIDTEGHEYEVLKGMKKILKVNDPIIMFEFDAMQFRRDNKIIKYLSKLNFKYFYFFDQNFNYYNYRMRNLLFLILRILIFGKKKNEISLKKIDEFNNQKNYFKDTFICSKNDLLKK